MAEYLFDTCKKFDEAYPDTKLSRDWNADGDSIFASQIGKV